MVFARVQVADVSFDAVTESQAVRFVRDALARGEGGRIITPNVDILRLASGRDGQVGRYVDDASLVVADGAPVVWASRLAGTPLPERVAGSDLVWSLSRMAAHTARSVFLLGGSPGVPGPARSGAAPPAARAVLGCATDRLRLRPTVAGSGAQRAAEVLQARCPGLRVAGSLSPPHRFDCDPGALAAVRDELVGARPDLVYVGLGFPRQERVISAVRPYLPGAWFLGCGSAINFVAGDRVRAPRWMRSCGLEWLHRLAAEPGRLGHRYLRRDLPFALRLLAGAVKSRYDMG
jgi:N-acetylglucosaminyldiphosphoundecaprenol N-acetyl-beta-D-mannosaminyltransferase